MPCTSRAGGVEAKLNEVFRFGPFELIGATLRANAEVIRVPPTELAALRCLVEADGALVHRFELKRRIWGDDGVADARLTRCVYALRRLLAEHGARDAIETRRGTGFRLRLSVERYEPAVLARRRGDATSTPREHYLRAHEFLGRRSRGNLARALAAAERAVELDPTDAVGSAFCASIHVSMTLRGIGAGPCVHARLADEAAERALRLDPQEPTAVGVRGWVRGAVEGDPDALDWFARGRGRDQDYQLRVRHAWTLFAMGRQRDALAEFEAASELGPLWQGTLFPYGYALFCTGRVEEADTYLRRKLVEVPISDAGFHALAIVAAWRGDVATAVEAAKRAVALSERLPVTLSGLAYAHAVAGDHAQARELLAEATAAADAHVPPSLLAAVHAGLGDDAAAQAAAARAVAQYCCFRGLARSDPRLAGIAWPPDGLDGCR